MPFLTPDDLSSWRRACLMAESFMDHLDSQTFYPDPFVIATENAKLVAALLAESGMQKSLKSRLDLLLQARSINAALLDQIQELGSLGFLPLDDRAILADEVAETLNSVQDLIRSLRASD